MKKDKSDGFKPLHAAIALSVICHLLAIYSFATFASEPPKEQLRIVAQVNVVDKLEAPPPPPPAKKLAVEAPQVVKNSKTPPQKVQGPKDRAPGKIGKTGAPGSPNSNKKIGNPGGSGRAGLRTAIDPNMPDVGADLLGGPGYPTGHGHGVGNKEGTGSGFGKGDGVGDGDGGGEDGEGGGGGGGGEDENNDFIGVVCFTSTNSGVTPSEFATPSGKLSFSFKNDSEEVRTLVVEGVGGNDESSTIYSNNWGGLQPGEMRVYTISANQGAYTITIRNSKGEEIQRAFLYLN